MKEKIEAKDWMVRRQYPNRAGVEGPVSCFEIQGPFSGSEVIQQIKEGRLTTFDEIGVCNQYWFNLADETEVKALLGIDPAQILAVGAQGGTKILSDSSDTETELDRLTVGTTGTGAKVRSTRPQGRNIPVPNRVRVPNRFEVISIWKSFAWVLAFFAGVLLYSIFHKLRGP